MKRSRSFSLATIISVMGIGCGTLVAGDSIENDQNNGVVPDKSSYSVTQERGNAEFNNVGRDIPTYSAGSDTLNYQYDGGIFRLDGGGGILHRDAGDTACYTNNFSAYEDIGALVIQSGSWDIYSEGRLGETYLRQTDLVEEWGIVYIPTTQHDNVEARVNVMIPRFREGNNHVALLFRYAAISDGGYIMGIEIYEGLGYFTLLEDLYKRVIQRVLITVGQYGRWHELRLTARGNEFIGYFDNQEVMRINNLMQGIGFIGLATYQSEARFRNLAMCRIGWE